MEKSADRAMIEFRAKEGQRLRTRKELMMKAYVLLTVCGPRVILTSCDSINSPELLKRLCAGGFTKFVAHEVPVDSAKTKYGMHFDIVCNNPHESDGLRVLDYRGERVCKNFSFKELGPPIYYESRSAR